MLDRIKSKRVTILGKSIPAMVIALLLMGGLASAGLLAYYGSIVTTVEVHQSIKLSNDGKTWLQCTPGYEQCTIEDSWIPEESPGGEKFCKKYWLKNQMSVEGTVDFDTTCTPDCDGIETHIVKNLDYSWSGAIGAQPVEITAEDGECFVEWTIDFPIDDDTCNGLMAVGLVIATSGEGNGPLFQIHNNDGTARTPECSANGDETSCVNAGCVWEPASGCVPWAWGTWLYSPWGPTIDDGWFGWHSGDTNTPVTDLDWVSATGGRYREGNPEGIFTITIDKCKLISLIPLEEQEEIHWALYTAIGSGFCSHAYQPATYPTAFTWSEPLVTGTNYELATIGEQLAGSMTIPSDIEQDFCLCYKFAENIAPDTYTITTKILPA